MKDVVPKACHHISAAGRLAFAEIAAAGIMLVVHDRLPVLGERHKEITGKVQLCIAGHKNLRHVIRGILTCAIAETHASLHGKHVACISNLQIIHAKMEWRRPTALFGEINMVAMIDATDNLGGLP